MAFLFFTFCFWCRRCTEVFFGPWARGVRMPRRFGKTIVIATLVVNYVTSRNSDDLCVVSSSNRTSGLLREKVMEALKNSGREDWIQAAASDYIRLRHPGNPDHSRKMIYFERAGAMGIAVTGEEFAQNQRGDHLLLRWDPTAKAFAYLEGITIELHWEKKLSAERDELLLDGAEEDQFCCICMCNARKITLVPCGHKHYCNKCLIKLYDRVHRKQPVVCPLCRAVVTDVDVSNDMESVD